MTVDEEFRERLQLLRSAGVPISETDARCILQSVHASLATLDAAVKGSLFDTEPHTFDVVLCTLARSKTHG